MIIILIVYVIIAGLLIPLKSGIESVEPSYGNAGETLKIQVTGYNTHFKEAGNSRNPRKFYLKCGSSYSKPGSMSAICTLRT